MAKGLVFAMENEGLEPVDGTDAGVDQAMVDASDAAQAIVTEAQEIANDIDDTVSATNDADTLANVADVVQKTVDEGTGVDPKTAEVAAVILESICVRLGIPNSHRLMPATESFGSSNTRLAATKVALENGFTDTIKRIWEAIKKFVKNTWTKIKDFFARFFVNAEKVKKAAEAIKEKASKLAGKRKDKDTFDSKATYSAFAQKGAIADTTVGEVLDNHTKLTDGVLTSAAGAGTAISSLQAAITAQGAAGDKLEGASKAAESYVGAIIKGASHASAYVKDSKASNDKKDVDVSSVGGYVNGASLNFIKTTTKPSSGSGVTSYSIEFSNRPVETQGEKKVKTLDTTGINTICDKVIDLMDKTIEFGKKKSDIEKLSTLLSKTVDVAIGNADATTAKSDYAAKEVNGNIKDLFTNLNATLTRVYTQTPAWNVKAGKSALTYCTQSMAQYKDA